MKIYWDDAGTWTQITGVVQKPDIITRNNMYGSCVVVVRDFEGALFTDWEPRDFTDMKVEDDATNILFQGILVGKKFKSKEVIFFIAGFAILLDYLPFNKDYIYAFGKVKTLNANTQIDLYTDKNDNGEYDALEDFEWDPDLWTNNNQHNGLLIVDTVENLTTLNWDASAQAATNLTIVSGVATDTNNPKDGNSVHISETGAVWGSDIDFTIDGVVIDSLVQYLKKLVINYRIYGELGAITSSATIYLQIDKDGSFEDIAVCVVRPTSFRQSFRMDGSFTIEDTNTELAKYFNVDGGDDYHELKEIRIYLVNDTGVSADIDIWIDHIDCDIYYHGYDVGPIMAGINESGASYVKTVGVTWDETGAGVDDDFKIGESTNFIIKDIALQSKLSIDIIKDLTNTSTFVIRPNADHDDGNWTPSAGADLYAAVDDVVSDPAAGDDVTITSNGANDICRIELELPTASDILYVTEIKIHALALTGILSTLSAAYAIGDAADSSYKTLVSADAVEDWYDVEWTGLTLLASDLTDLRVCLKNSSAINQSTVDVIYVTITYVQDSWNKYMARHFKGGHCIDALNAVRTLEGADWCEDHVNKRIKVLKKDDYESSGVSLDSTDYDHDWEYEDKCNQVKRVDVWGSTRYGIHTFKINDSVSGDITKQIIDEMVSTEADGQYIANSLASLYSTKRPSIKLTLDGVRSDLVQGKTVNITLERPTVGAANYPIRMLKRESRGRTGIKTIVYAGLGETEDDEEIGRAIRRIGDLAHKAMSDKLIASVITGDTSIQWSDVGGAEAAVNALIDVILNTGIPPSIYGGDQGFLLSLNYWYVLNADPNARLWVSIICPETRADWKIILITMNSVGNQFVSGTLSLGTTGDNEVDSANNIHNNINWDITHPAVAYTYEFKITAAFSATERDVIRYHYATDANDGAGSMYVMGVVLVHD